MKLAMSYLTANGQVILYIPEIDEKYQTINLYGRVKFQFIMGTNISKALDFGPIFYLNKYKREGNMSLARE